MKRVIRDLEDLDALGTKFGDCELGLSICLNLLQQMAGSFTVERKSGHGASFVFTFRTQSQIFSGFLPVAMPRLTIVSPKSTPMTSDWENINISELLNSSFSSISNFDEI